MATTVYGRTALELVLALGLVAAFVMLGHNSYADAPAGRSRRSDDTELLSRLSILEQRLIDLESSPLRGLDGIDGAMGPRGYQGERGFTGKTGPRGDRGRPGKDGRDGFCAVLDSETGEIQVPCPEQANSAKDAELQELKGVVAGLTRVITILQVTLEQRVRSEGGSGLTQVRNYGGGSQSYHEVRLSL